MSWVCDKSREIHARRKIDTYTKNGFIQGKDIIYTFESEGYSLNTMSVELLVKDIFSV